MAAPEEPHQDDVRRTEQARTRIGSTLRGKWRLDGLLGMGGMAAVYTGTHRNGMRGAVKILDLELARHGSMRDRFLREGYLANAVEHPAAVRVLDDDTTEDGTVFLVMELLSGRTLEAMAEARNGRLPLEEVCLAMGQLLDGLAHAHSRAIIHRDIKPDNLFWTTDDKLKVLDFGLARVMEEERSRSSTQTGAPMGTPAFMSPEQARGKTRLVDAQSDLYSVGATMFSLLSGQLVHGDEETVAEIIAATFMKQARSLAVVAPEMPAPLVAVVDRALRLEKSERWKSARSMRSALSAAFFAATGEPLPLPLPITADESAPVSRPSNDAIFSFSPSWSQRPKLHSEAIETSPAVPAPPTAPSLPPMPPSRMPRRIAAVAAGIVLVGCGVWYFGGNRQHTTDSTVAAASASPPPATAAPEPTSTPSATPQPTAQPAATQAAVTPVATTVATTPPATTPLARHAPVVKGTPTASASKDAAPAANVYDRRY